MAKKKVDPQIEAESKDVANQKKWDGKKPAEASLWARQALADYPGADTLIVDEGNNIYVNCDVNKRTEKLKSIGCWYQVLKGEVSGAVAEETK